MRLLNLPPPVLLAVLSATPGLAQLTLDTSSPQSVKDDAKSIAQNMVNIYSGYVDTPGTGIPGVLGPPYYWWEGGAMFGVLIDYWYYTGDE